ncbi:MAG: PepSY-like domain-containing protein [Tannerellaceae bacterium]|jgi:hypothetical protein|nr:PepSY-like domain-containing protein [Tannerellaceae bacterium]
MKSLIKHFCLILSIVLWAASCNDSNGTSREESLEQHEIQAKIAAYYSSPASSASSVAAIQTAFSNRFPGARDVEWKVSHGVYEIDFEINDTDYEAWYDSEARLLMYKHDIANGELPKAVSSAAASDYPGYVLDEAEKVYKGNITGYYLDLEKGKDEAHAFYGEDGSFIAKNLWEDDAIKPAQNADATVPEVSGNLPDDEADALIAAYYSGRNEDVRPSDVPAAVLSGFNTVFSGARDIDWEVSANVYKVDFEINNVDYDAWYRPDGTLLAYKFDVTRSSLPQVVNAAITSRFAGYGIDDAEKVVKAGSAGYLVELESRNMEEDAYFGEDGTYISDAFYRKGATQEPGKPETPETPEAPEIPVDGNYTDEQIDALLAAYRQGRDRDIAESKVPTAVTSAFHAQFTATRDIEWDYAANVYKVEFEVNRTEHEAWYAEDGALLMYTMEVRYKSVPAAVQNAILSQYAGYTADECDYFRKGSIAGYVIEVENKRTGAELVVIYKEDGTFISQQRDCKGVVTN